MSHLLEVSGSERDPQTFAIIGAAMSVHQELGSGFLENTYQEAFSLELSQRNIPFSREVDARIRYKGHLLQSRYRMDFVCFGRVIVEVKAISQLAGIHEAQGIHYLKATGFECGLLINFGAARLEYKRLILSRPKLS